LDARGVSQDFGGLRALDDVSLRIQEGEVFGLIGPNGAGKTTFFNIVTGFLRSSDGSIFYRDKEITALEPFRIAKLGLLRTFQITSVFPELTAEENIVIGCHLKRKCNLLHTVLRTKGYRARQQELKYKANHVLKFIGMEKEKDTLACNLAFGDQRRLEIGIALAGEPELLLLDEPAAGMNPEESLKLVNFIQQMNKSGITILIVEHNMKVVMEVCNRIAVLNQGRQIAEGTPDSIAESNEVISVYLGGNHKYA